MFWGLWTACIDSQEAANHKGPESPPNVISPPLRPYSPQVCQMGKYDAAHARCTHACRKYCTLHYAARARNCFCTQIPIKNHQGCSKFEESHWTKDTCHHAFIVGFTLHVASSFDMKFSKSKFWFNTPILATELQTGRWLSKPNCTQHALLKSSFGKPVPCVFAMRANPYGVHPIIQDHQAVGTINLDCSRNRHLNVTRSRNPIAYEETTCL